MICKKFNLRVQLRFLNVETGQQFLLVFVVKECEYEGMKLIK